ncbi:MAG: hypothetical protein KGI90_08335 [Burkholderiales bacterium]|nr:hypothetical protein [Burkholderiales bacterium]MDE2275876.1 hypothetical protein [Burkholderiales bacterium]
MINRKLISRRHWLAAVMGTATTAALAQGPAAGGGSYGVVSEAAHEIALVGATSNLGTRLGNTLRRSIPLQSGSLDTAALWAARDALRQSAPQAPVWLVAPTTDTLFDAHQHFAEGAAITIPADLAQGLHENRCSQLLLFTRDRGPAALATSNTTEGEGTLEGVGLYVDNVTALRTVGSADEGVGFVAAYAYLRASLIDAASGRLVRTRTHAQGYVLAHADGIGAVSAWDAVSPEAKAQALSRLLKQGVQALVAPLLAA